MRKGHLDHDGDGMTDLCFELVYRAKNYLLNVLTNEPKDNYFFNYVKNLKTKFVLTITY